MYRYFAELTFNGTRYHGWQLQKNAHTVQAEVNRAFTTLLHEDIATLGAGRTDTGVHARQFFAHFDCTRVIANPEELVFHLNGILPPDIVIRRIFSVDKNVHARFDAVARTYEYLIYQHKDPFLKECAYFVPGNLDQEVMKQVCKFLLLHEDFSSFSRSHTQVKTNLCSITHASWIKKDNMLVFTITANRFLRNMVRAIVGTMIEAGKGRINATDFEKIMKEKKRSVAGASVPAHGLYLTKVEYKFAV